MKINRDKTNRRETARRQKSDAHNVRLTLFFAFGTWDQDVEEEHLTLLDGRRFETKNYACDALPARRRKPTGTPTQRRRVAERRGLGPGPQRQEAAEA